MTRTTGPGGMLPEQVWDDVAPAGRPGFEPGTPTFSATPLSWTHAQYLRLARNLDKRRITDRPAVVAERYLR
jgi:glucoamylase